MCERKRIRYQHLMRHPEWPENVGAGSVCAGKMENNKAAAKHREREARNRFERRRRWPSLVAWKKSDKGNHYISRDGIHILLYRKKNRQWGIRVSCEYTGDEKWGKKQFSTLKQAKLSSFVAHEYARDQLGWGIRVC